MVKIKLLFIICMVSMDSFSVYSQTDTHDSIRELNKQGKACLKKGMYREAEAAFVKAFKLHKQSSQAKETDHIETLNGLANICLKKGFFDKADTLLNRAFNLQKEGFKKTSLEYAETLYSFAILNMVKQQYTDVEELLKKALGIRKKKLGKIHAEYAETLNSLGYFYVFTSRFDEAEAILNEAARICSKTSGKTSLEYANSMLLLGSYYFFKGDYRKSQEKYNLSIEIIQTNVGKNHPDYAGALLVNSTLEVSIGKYDVAEKAILQVCSIIENLYGKKHPTYAAGLSNLGGIHLKTGNYQKAEELLLESMQLTKEILGEKHSYYFNALNSLALVYQNNGMNEKAESHLLQSLHLRKEVYGEQHPSVANAMNSLAKYYAGLYNFEQAERLFQKALSIEKNTTGESSASYATSLINLAILYEKKCDFNQALLLSEKAISIFKRSLGESHLNYLGALENYVNIQMSDTSYDKKSVEKVLTDLCKKRKSILGEAHPGYARSLNNLAQYYDQTGEPEKAELLYKKALRIIDEKSPFYLPIISNFGGNQHLSGKIKPAQAYYAKSIQVIKKQIEQNLLFLSEKEQSLHWNSLEYYSNLYKTFFYQYNDSIPSYSGFIYNYELFSKALLLNSSRKTRQSIIDNGGGKLLELLKSMEKSVLYMEYQIMKDLEINSSSQLHDILLTSNDKELIELSDEINKYKEYINQEEKELVLKSREYNQYKTELSLEWKEIQNVLNKNEVAIEFLNFDDIDLKKLTVKDTIYGALLLRAYDPYPQMIPLCNARELQDALRQFKHNPNAIYSKIWKPIEKHLNGATHIYLAPAGLLHNVSFAGIKKENKYLGDEYIIHNLLSTKDLIRLKKTQTKPYTTGHAVLFGGADFSLSLQETTLPYPDQGVSTLTNLTRSMLDYMDPTRGQGFGYLPGSKKEAQLIEKQLSGYRWITKSFTDIHATETRFKLFSGTDSIPSPRLIHISTHGFYFPSPKNNNYEEKQLLSTDQNLTIYRLSDNPLMRTGLAFTGANHVWKGGDPIDGMDDGILTAYEVSNMNLTHTELVVLSACETGLGDINGSEGVYGLQRAFRLAGVQTMLVSLWKVPDKETAELMTEFYALWAKGFTKKRAFTEAQQKLRHTYPDDPEKWAGFIMIE